MNTRPRLTRSIPFWLLIAGSLASAIIGAVVLLEKLQTMETALTEGTATGVEVYVGQVWGVLAAILIGVGVLGLGLAAALGALRSVVRPAAPAAPEFEPELDEPVFEPELDEPATGSERVAEGEASVSPVGTPR